MSDRRTLIKEKNDFSGFNIFKAAGMIDFIGDIGICMFDEWW